MIGKLFIATVIAFSGVCVAAKAQTLRQCEAKTDEKERLACFDKLAKQSEPTEQQETSNTPKKIEPPSGEYRVVDPGDIFVAYGKYLGKPIEVRNVRCYYADKDDYRCIATGDNPVVFFAEDIEPATAREAIENDCGEVKKVVTPACKRNIRLTAENISDDLISGYQKRVDVRSSSLEVIEAAPVETKKRGRRR